MENDATGVKFPETGSEQEKGSPVDEAWGAFGSWAEQVFRDAFEAGLKGGQDEGNDPG